MTHGCVCMTLLLTVDGLCPSAWSAKTWLWPWLWWWWPVFSPWTPSWASSYWKWFTQSTEGQVPASLKPSRSSPRESWPTETSRLLQPALPPPLLREPLAGPKETRPSPTSLVTQTSLFSDQCTILVWALVIVLGGMGMWLFIEKHLKKQISYNQEQSCCCIFVAYGQQISLVRWTQFSPHIPHIHF